MALPSITVTARLAADIEYRNTASGLSVANLRLVSNGRKFDKDTNAWVDSDTWWGNATAFGRTAEAIAEAGLQKGELVTVTGRVKTDEWEDKTTGAKRSADKVIIDDIGRTLTPPRQQQGGGYGQQSGGFGAPSAQATNQAAQGGFGGAPADDPWGQGGRPGFSDDQPPF